MYRVSKGPYKKLFHNFKVWSIYKDRVYTNFRVEKGRGREDVLKLGNDPSELQSPFVPSKEEKKRGGNHPEPRPVFLTP